jgi:hypothetical protein
MSVSLCQPVGNCAKVAKGSAGRRMKSILIKHKKNPVLLPGCLFIIRGCLRIGIDYLLLKHIAPE